MSGGTLHERVLQTMPHGAANVDRVVRRRRVLRDVRAAVVRLVHTAGAVRVRRERFARLRLSRRRQRRDASMRCLAMARLNEALSTRSMRPRIPMFGWMTMGPPNLISSS